MFNEGFIAWEIRTGEHEFAATACIIQGEVPEDPERIKVKVLTTGVSTVTSASKLFHSLADALEALRFESVTHLIEK
jgi:hypothetical protein